VEEAMLLASTDLSVQQASEQAAQMGGLVIAAHVDRPAYSLISQLGFIPADVRLDAVEVSRRLDWTTARQKIAAIGELPVIVSSDAHTIDDFVSGPKTMFHVESPTLAEMRQALEAGNRRRIHR
jgi:PHP family Zn ribbon phosphoesterase